MTPRKIKDYEARLAKYFEWADQVAEADGAVEYAEILTIDPKPEPLDCGDSANVIAYWFSGHA